MAENRELALWHLVNMLVLENAYKPHEVYQNTKQMVYKQAWSIKKYKYV
jgi:hypothetical protein